MRPVMRQWPEDFDTTVLIITTYIVLYVTFQMVQ